MNKHFHPLFAGMGLLLAASCQSEPQDNALTGYIRADYIYAAPSEFGRIAELYVTEGQEVEIGAPLFRLEDTVQRAALTQARAELARTKAVAANLGIGARQEELDALYAQLSEAEAQFELAEDIYIREMSLIETGAVSIARGDRVRAERETARARVTAARKSIDVARLPARTDEQSAAAAAVDAAQAQLEHAEWALSERQVLAAAKGQVDIIIHRPGEMVGPSSPALNILSPEQLKLRFYVNQADLPQVRLGDEVRLSAEGLSSSVTARVSYISREAEFTPPVIFSAETRDKLVFAVDATLPDNADIPPGLPVDVYLP